MLPSDESLKILQMIEQGQISAEQGIHLLNQAASAPAAVAAPQVEPESVQAPEATVQPALAAETPKGWLRVRVTDMNTNRSKVTVNLPMSLMAAGMKIGAHFAPELNGLDLTQVFQELRETHPGKIVDVMDEEDGEHVEIFVE